MIIYQTYKRIVLRGGVYVFHLSVLVINTGEV